MFLPEAAWRQGLPQARVARALGVASGTRRRSTSGSCCALLVSSVVGDTTGPVSRLCRPSARRCRHVFLPGVLWHRCCRLRLGELVLLVSHAGGCDSSPRPSQSLHVPCCGARTVCRPSFGSPPWDFQSLSYSGPRVILSYPPPTLVTRRAVSWDVRRPLCCPC